MDLNDPRRRLQVLNNASPSIRLATAPQPQQQQISIAQPKANITIAQPKASPVQAAPEPQVNPNKFKLLSKSNEKNKTIFGMNAAWLLPKGNEKVASYGAGGDYEANPQDFLKQFDNLDEAGGIKGAYVNDLKKKSATDPVAANTLRILQENGRFKGDFEDFAAGANDKLYGGLSRGFLRGVDFVLPGHNTFGFEQEANRQEAQPQYTTAGKIGEKVGNVEKGIVDVASMAIGGGIAEKGASKVPALAEFIDKLGKGGRVSRAAAKALGILPGSLGGSATDVLQTAGRGDEQNVGKSVALGTAIDLGLPFLGSGVRKGLKLFGKEAEPVLSKTAQGFFKDLADEVDPQAVKKALGDGVPDDIISYLTSETNPQTVEQIMRQLEIDPNVKLSDEVRQRLQDEGVKSVKEDPNAQYAAEYQDGNITARSQADLDANVYHELGHHIYETKLTPEEKALFKGSGEASQQAVGRAGYTPENVNSEDFSDYLNKALNGRINEVPQEYRSVIEKYARIAPQEADNIGAVLPNGAGTTTQDQVQKALTSGDVSGLLEAVNPRPGPITGEGPNPFVISDRPDNVKIGKDIKKIDNELEKVRQGTSTKSADEIRALNTEREALAAKAAGETPSAEVAAQADAVGKAQSGTADGQVTGSGQTTSTQATGDVSGAGLEGNTELGGKAVKSAENASESVIPQKAEDLLPSSASPEDHAAVQSVLDSLNREGGTLDRAQVGYDAAQKARKAETGARIGKGQALYEEAGGGEQGFRSKLGSLRGKKTGSGYTPVSVDPEVENHLLDAVEKSGLKPYEKLNTQNALRKVWGANPEKPTASDINNIRTFLNKNFGEGKGDEVADGIAQAIKDGRDWKDVASEVAGLPRALMATGDLSGGFRQAMPLGTRFPKEWARANKASVEWAASPAKYEKAMREIADSPNYQTVQDLMGVDLTGIGAMQDEAFIGAGMAEKIPGAGHVVKAADRAYTGVLTKMRWDVANRIIDEAGGADQFLKNAEELYGDKTKDYMRSFGEVINTFTGRGGKKGGALDQHMKTLSTGLFAPRLWAANIQRLNPVWYAKLAKSNPQAAKLAIQSQGTFLTMAGTVLGLASLAGAQVGTDPRSADFGKIKMGNTRYDILGGQQQNVVQIVRQATGQKVNSETGEVANLGEGYGAKTRFDLFTDMLENKSNPLLGFGIKLMNTKPKDGGNPFIREDQYGNDFNIGTESARLGIPLGLQGAYDTSKDMGNPVKGTIANAPSFFGVGVQTYGNTATKDQGKDENGKLTFGGKITPDMPLDESGRPFLDEKGKVVKVKFDKNATEMEKKAALIEAQQSAYKDKAKRSMSENDRGIYKLGEADKDQLDEQQLKKYNQLKKYVENYGKAIDVPEGAKSSAATTFYKKYNSMSKDDQEAWLKESPDENAKTITGLLNKERSKGLSEFKPSNEISKAYSEYEKDLNDHPEYTEVDKRNKAKAFQTYVYKQNYSDDQRDIFAEGGSADLKTLIDEKQVDKKDLDEAIKMDNELYNSGLTGSLKFSKTFRKNFGYGLPDGGGVNKNIASGGDGSGGSNDSVNAHLLDYLPSQGSTASSPAPQFSSRKRTQGISFKSVNTPSKGSGKKISINL